MKNKFRGPPYPPKKADFGQTKAKKGRFSQKGWCYSFGILHGLLSDQTYEDSNERKKIGGPPYPPQKAVFEQIKAEIGCCSQ